MIPDTGYDLNSFASSSSTFASDDERRASLIQNGIHQRRGSKDPQQLYQLTFTTSDSDDEEETLINGNISTLNGTGATSPHHLDPNSSQLALEGLVHENLSLQQKLSRKSDELIEARAQLRGYSNGGCSLDGSFNSDLTAGDSASSQHEVIRLEALRKEGSLHSGLLDVFNVPEFARIIVYDLKPRLAKRLPPCLPANLLTAAFRFFDQTGDDVALTGLFNAVHSALKDPSMNSTDIDLIALWLVNCWRLLNLLRQHSSHSTIDTQFAIKNFNLEPLVNQLKHRVQVFYNSLMKKIVEPLLAPKIVPGVLQHEESCQFSSHSQQAAGGMQNGKEAVKCRSSLVDLLEFLNFVRTKLLSFGADEVLLGQVFGQITRWICALALNHMMFRRELCTSDKAISIKHNVREIQLWLREHRIGGGDGTMVGEMLDPLIQASHLLQLRKSEAYLDTLCGEMTSKLRPKQVLAILQHFTPSDGFEESAVDEALLEKVGKKLAAERSASGEEEKDSLLMRGTYLEPFDCEPFVPSDFPLDQLSLPACLNLQSVSRLI